MESSDGLREEGMGGRAVESRGRKWWMETREKEVEDKNGEWRTELSMRLW